MKWWDEIKKGFRLGPIAKLDEEIPDMDPLTGLPRLPPGFQWRMVKKEVETYSNSYTVTGKANVLFVQVIKVSDKNRLMGSRHLADAIEERGLYRTQYSDRYSDDYSYDRVTVIFPHTKEQITKTSLEVYKLFRVWYDDYIQKQQRDTVIDTFVGDYPPNKL